MTPWPTPVCGRDPPLRQLVLGWYEPGLRWAIMSLFEDDTWFFHRDIGGLTCPKHNVRVWIELPPDPPASLLARL